LREGGGIDVLACPRCGGRFRLIALRPCDARAHTLFSCGPAIRARRKTRGEIVVFQRALIKEAAVIERILRHLHLPTEVPAPRPGRAPPPLETGLLNQDTDIAVFESYA